MLPRAETSRSPQRAEPPSTALLVDDSELALRFLQKKLAPYGLITECVANSEAAMKRLAQRRYDFVFLDMELGDPCQFLDGDAGRRIHVRFGGATGGGGGRNLPGDIPVQGTLRLHHAGQLTEHR